MLVLLVWANRYFFGLYLKITKGTHFDEATSTRVPTVTIVVPLFNEGKSIYQTIESLVDLDYPRALLQVIVVDDCSTDDSYEWALRGQRDFDNVRVIRNPHNMGKRLGINHAVRVSTSEIVVSVDSDVLVDRNAVRELVKRFSHPQIAAVGGRVNVSNANENWLTRMQTVKYFFGYEYMKNLEKYFRSVMCLSGCLTAYRRSVLIELEPILENRVVFGVPIKYGEDRFLTRQIVKAGYQTVSTLDAVCFTKAPPTLAKYFAQQLRWRRSNIIDFFGGISHAWRLHPMVAIHYLSLSAMLLSYPVVIFYNLAQGSFWQLSVLHLMILSFMGAIYYFGTRSLARPLRVHPLYFLPMAFVMPVTYLLITPLALFTLDSSSWETRGATSSPKPDPIAKGSISHGPI